MVQVASLGHCATSPRRLAYGEVMTIAADIISIACTSPLGKIEELAREAWTWNSLHTFASPCNEALLKISCQKLH